MILPWFFLILFFLILVSLPITFYWLMKKDEKEMKDEGIIK